MAKQCLKSRILSTLLNYGFDYNIASYYANYDERGGLREINRIKKQMNNKNQNEHKK